MLSLRNCSETSLLLQWQEVGKEEEGNCVSLATAHSIQQRWYIQLPSVLRRHIPASSQNARFRFFPDRRGFFGCVTFFSIKRRFTPFCVISIRRLIHDVPTPQFPGRRRRRNNNTYTWVLSCRVSGYFPLLSIRPSSIKSSLSHPRAKLLPVSNRIGFPLSSLRRAMAKNGRERPRNEAR